VSTPSDLFTQTEPDLIDRIADALPEHVRADYYREMSHLRLLPENDEMLRILRAMQFLALLIEQAPAEMAYERQELSALLTASLQSMQQTHQAGLAYQKKLEQRLIQLPEEIARGISPEAIAAKINESLRQQFAQTGMPETAQALGVIAKQLNQSAGEFHKTTVELTGTYRGVAAQASDAMVNMQNRISAVTYIASEAVRELKVAFLREYKWSVAVLTLTGILVGVPLGMLFEHGREANSPDPGQAAPMVQALPSAPPAAPAAGTAKPVHKKHMQPPPAPQAPSAP